MCDMDIFIKRMCDMDIFIKRMFFLFGLVSMSKELNSWLTGALICSGKLIFYSNNSPIFLFYIYYEKHLLVLYYYYLGLTGLFTKSSFNTFLNSYVY